VHIPGPDLDCVQRWMQSVITHPTSVIDGLKAAETRRHLDVGADGVEQVVTRSRSLSGVERLAIYSTAYYARLLECLREEFAVLRHALDDDIFNSFAVDYIRTYPPGSYTLCQLGANFPRFLAESRPAKEDGAANEPDWADFLIELALLERTFGDVFDGPGVEGRTLLDSAAFAAVPVARWPEARLTPVPCLRLLALRYPVAEYFTSVKQGDNPDLPELADTFLAITRRRYVVRHVALSRAEHAVLGALLAGRTVLEAVGMAAEDGGDDLDQLAAELGEWFRVWAVNGFFLAVEFGDGAPTPPSSSL
jgi:hypothetical protein